MSLQQITPPYADDGRLKILLVDDLAGNSIRLPDEMRPRLQTTLTYTPWLAITSVTDLDDMSDVMEASAMDRDDGSVSHSCAPFDVYILDFKMCDAEGNCRNPRHLRNGMHHAAAGLVAGVATAQKYPRHVQALIPWSAYIDEAKDFMGILSAVQADNLYISDTDTTSKARVNLAGVLAKHAAPSFREALTGGLAEGIVAIPDGERDRIAILLEKAPDWIAADTMISLSTADGLRGFKLGSLFFDAKKRVDGVSCVPTDLVKALLAGAQRSDPIYHRARQLAETFWKFRQTDESFLAYAAIRNGEVPPVDMQVPWIGDSIWRPAARKQAVEGIRTVRLAILFLILFEYHFRLQATKITTELVDSQTLAVLRLLVSVHHSNRMDSFVEEACEDLPQVAELLLRVPKMDEQFRARGMMSTVDAAMLQLPLTEADIVQLVDPLPTPRNGERHRDNYTSTLGEGSKIAAGFQRLLDGDKVGAPGKTLDPAALLLSDPAAARAMCLETEWNYLHLVASELMVAEDQPSWLSGSGEL